jgi:hypothetical protein
MALGSTWEAKTKMEKPTPKRRTRFLFTPAQHRAQAAAIRAQGVRLDLADTLERVAVMIERATILRSGLLDCPPFNGRGPWAKIDWKQTRKDMPNVERTPAGMQTVIPGCERRTIPKSDSRADASGQALLPFYEPPTQKEKLDRLAAAPIKPRRLSKPR